MRAGTLRRRDAGRPAVDAVRILAHLLGLGVLGEACVRAHLLAVDEQELESRLLVADDAHGLGRLEDP